MNNPITEWEKAKQAAANNRRGRCAKTQMQALEAETHRKAMRKQYDREHMVTVTMKLHRDYDSDIIEKLENVDGSRQGYIKSLILADIEMEKAADTSDETSDGIVAEDDDIDEYIELDSKGWDEYIERSFD